MLSKIKTLFKVREESPDSNPRSFKKPTFKPQNPIEHQIIRLLEKEIPISEFLMDLMNADLHILSQNTETEKALVIRDKSGQLVLPFFTSAKRAQISIEKKPQYKCLLRVKVGDFLNQISDSVGVVLNPFWDRSPEWTPQQIDQLKKDMAKGDNINFHAKITSYHSGQITKKTLISYLNRADIGLLVHSKNQKNPKQNILTATINQKPFFCLFSTPEFAENTKMAQPDFKVITIIRGNDLLSITPNNYGYFINPGTDLSVEIKPEELFVS